MCYSGKCEYENHAGYGLEGECMWWKRDKENDGKCPENMWQDEESTTSKVQGDIDGQRNK